MLNHFTLATAAVVLASAAAARADISGDFLSNPLSAPGVLIQGPDAGNAATRFTYDGAAGTVTAHYDTQAPTVKLLLPLGTHLTETNAINVSVRIDVLSTGLVIPPDFSAQAVSFGLVNSVTTGSVRASTGFLDSDFNFHQVAPGTAYDLMTFDYFPTTDNTFGGSSVSLTTVRSPGTDDQFNDYFGPGAFASSSLPTDQFFTAGFSYNPTTHQVTLSWNGNTRTADMTGAEFNVDSFAITLWNDPNLTADGLAVRSGEPVKADVVFDSFLVQAPEPASVAMLAALPLLLIRRRRRA